MKILQVCSARQLGGGEKHLADLANALARRGHDVFAALSPYSPLLAELPAVPKQNLVELRLRNSMNVASALKLARFAREHQIEIIHAHIARDYPLAAFVSRRAGARLVLTRHVLFPMSGIHRLTLRHTARVIAVSQAVADGLRQQGIFAPDTIALIHNGIDVDRFARAAGAVRKKEAAGQESPGERLRVGMVGHLAPIKGQEDFIRAAAIVCGLRDDVEFIIAGEDKSLSGQNRQSIERLIAELDLNQRVRLSGWVDDIAELLPTFDLFVSPSRSEPFGLSIVEAMAAGTPVVASMSEGAREIIDGNLTGRLFPISDVEALAKAICELLSDPSQRGQLSANAQRVVRERFSLEQMVVETEKVYEQVLERS